jgi:hypothetical protein
MNRMIRLLPVLLLAGCCVETFIPKNTSRRVYEVQDLCSHLRISEVELRNRLDVELSKQGFQSDVVAIIPQKGILVIDATREAHVRIQQILVEMGL